MEDKKLQVLVVEDKLENALEAYVHLKEDWNRVKEARSDRAELYRGAYKELRMDAKGWPEIGRVDVAFDLEGALETLNKQKYDAVLTDLCFPERGVVKFNYLPPFGLLKMHLDAYQRGNPVRGGEYFYPFSSKEKRRELKELLTKDKEALKKATELLGRVDQNIDQFTEIVGMELYRDSDIKGEHVGDRQPMGCYVVKACQKESIPIAVITDMPKFDILCDTRTYEILKPGQESKVTDLDTHYTPFLALVSTGILNLNTLTPEDVRTIHNWNCYRGKAVFVKGEKIVDFWADALQMALEIGDFDKNKRRERGDE